MPTLAPLAGRSSNLPRALCLGTLALLVGGALLLAGCGGKGRGQGRANNGDAIPTSESEPRDFQEFLTGDWAVTLNPDEPMAMEVPMTLTTTPPVGADVPVSGSMAGITFTDGRFATAAAGGPTLSFTTDTLTVSGADGEMTIDGPIQWTAVLEQGRLVGTATGADGTQGAWRGEKR